MAVFPFQYVNRRGIPVLKTTGVTVETTGVVFSFPNHAFANSWYRGLVLVGTGNPCRHNGNTSRAV